MKLVIEVYEDGSKYAMFEDEKHHKIIENKDAQDGGRKGLKKLDPNLLNHECNLDVYSGYFVFDIKEV